MVSHRPDHSENISSRAYALWHFFSYFRCTTDARTTPPHPPLHLHPRVHVRHQATRTRTGASVWSLPFVDHLQMLFLIAGAITIPSVSRISGCF